MITINKYTLKSRNFLHFIKKHLITEKTNKFLKNQKYVFIMDKAINKNQIKLIFERIYNTPIISINTSILPIKRKKMQKRYKIKSQFKKVYIRLLK